MTSNRQADRGIGAAAARAALEARLDAALAETFPASDPVAITICAGPGRNGPNEFETTEEDRNARP